jgi:hypothetical protein
MFHVGQKVVCVDASPWFGAPHLAHTLTKGSVYTVKDYSPSDFTEPSLMLCEVAWPPWMFARRFRPVIERKTDISVFTQLLNPANHKELVG